MRKNTNAYRSPAPPMAGSNYGYYPGYHQPYSQGYYPPYQPYPAYGMQP